MIPDGQGVIQGGYKRARRGSGIRAEASDFTPAWSNGPMAAALQGAWLARRRAIFARAIPSPL
jgi:hypothetical protein